MKKKHHNEITKLKYYENLQHVDHKKESTIRKAEKAIDRFEKFTRRADFRTFNSDQAMQFKKFLEEAQVTNSNAVCLLAHLRHFFKWLSQQPGYRKRINPVHADYLALPQGTTRAARAQVEKPFPSLGQIIAAVDNMPTKTDIELRNRAIVATVAITGIRVDALITIKVKHFDKARMLFIQDPHEVSTKFRKLINTFVFPLDPDLENILISWVDHLKSLPKITVESPLFPKSNVSLDEEGNFTNSGLSEEHWATTSPIREIFKGAFCAIDEVYYNPHSFRNMIVAEAYRRKLSAKEFKAWSQNLGHESMLTTWTSYGKIPLLEQEILIRDGDRYQESTFEKPLTEARLEEILRKRGI